MKWINSEKRLPIPRIDVLLWHWSDYMKVQYYIPPEGDYASGWYPDRNIDGRFGEPSYPTTFNKDSIVNDCPHYSDPNFQNKEQTIFGKKEKNLHYVYSDRLFQWDCKKHELASKIANKKEKLHTCTHYEIYLSEYYDKPVEIKHIIAGVNRANGYPYLVFGYIEKENNK